MGEPSQGRCDGVAVKGGQRYAEQKRSRRCCAFGTAAEQGRARNLGRHEDIDRLISRAEEADGSCLEERSFQQALEDPGETTWRYRHAGCHQARAGFHKYRKPVATGKQYRSERTLQLLEDQFPHANPPKSITRNGRTRAMYLNGSPAWPR